MKTRVTLLFAFLLLFISTAYSQNENLYNNAVGACITVYGIYYDNTGEPIGTSTGTGFFIGDTKDGLFCTAYHVVKGANEVLIDYGYTSGIIPNDFINLTRVFPLNTSRRFNWIDESRDLIIFKLPSLFPSKSLTLNTTLPNQGEAIHTIGNTFGDYTMKLSSGQTSQIMQGNMMKWIISEFTGLGGGNSGGPVFNKYGDVIGLVDMQDTRNNSIIWIIPSSYISYMVEDIKTRGTEPELGKKIDDAIVTPDIYFNLTPYDKNKFKNVK